MLLNSGPRPPKNPTAQHVDDEDDYDNDDEDNGDDDADIDGGDDNNGDADHDDDDDGDDDDDDDDDNNDDASSNVDDAGIWKRLLHGGLLHNIFSSHKPEQILPQPSKSSAPPAFSISLVTLFFAARLRRLSSGCFWRSGAAMKDLRPFRVWDLGKL